MGYKEIMHEILKDRCREYIKTKKSQFEFLSHDEIFLSIMAERYFRAWKEEDILTDKKCFEDGYYIALNYYMDRLDVSEEAVEYIKNHEDYEEIVAAKPGILSCYDSERFHRINKKAFTEEQLKILCLGIACGVDISIYENPHLSYLQMYEILLGLVSGLSESSVKEYAFPKYPAYLMCLIRKGMLYKLDVESLFNVKLTEAAANDLYKQLVKSHLFSDMKENLAET